MVSLFIPSDASPKEIRDCLHEEFAQGLGPLNDLYRLPNSVFNDANIHTILTDFDMMVLRATYAPELRSGMTRVEVAARLPAILRLINPAGEGVAYRALPPTSRAWIKNPNRTGTRNARRGSHGRRHACPKPRAGRKIQRPPLGL